MVRHVSAVLMHHNLCKQQRLTYIYTNGVFYTIDGRIRIWNSRVLALMVWGPLLPSANSSNSGQGWWTLGEGSQLDVNKDLTIYRTATARKHCMICPYKGHEFFIINRISVIHFKKLRT